MFFKGFNISIQGFSHIEKKIVCQDNSSYYCDESKAIAVVADGHGSEKHFRSDIGSKIAVDTSIYSINEFMKDRVSFDKAIIDNSNKVLKRIECNILYNWNNLVCEHYNNNKITESEIGNITEEVLKKISIEVLYGSTLIIAVMTKSYWFGIHIGDGNCVSIYEDGQSKILIPYDSRLIANFTTSLCDSDAINNFRHYYSTQIPEALLVSTDGLSGSFFDENTFLNFNRRIVSEMVDYNETIENLRQHLYKRSKEGSSDDISIAGIYKSDIDFNKLKISKVQNI